jgi:hypothetical protein
MLFPIDVLLLIASGNDVFVFCEKFFHPQFAYTGKLSIVFVSLMDLFTAGWPSTSSYQSSCSPIVAISQHDFATVERRPLQGHSEVNK